jgi:hypothetical protein
LAGVAAAAKPGRHGGRVASASSRIETTRALDAGFDKLNQRGRDAGFDKLNQRGLDGLNQRARLAVRR